MRRQFVRFYISLLAVMLIAALIFSTVITRQFDDAVDEKIEQFMAPLVDTVREQIAQSFIDPVELQRSLDDINVISPVPVHLTDQPDRFLTREAMAQLTKGKIVVVRNIGARSVYAAVAGGKVVHIGPIPFVGTTTPINYLMLPPLILLTLAGLILYLLIRPIERRIFTLSDVARRFGAGDLSSRVQVGKGGSLDEMEKSFNWMADKIEDLVDGQKELLRAVSHDLRTPLARLFFLLDDAQDAKTLEKAHGYLNRMDNSLTELNTLVDELMAYIRLDRPVAQLNLQQVPLSKLFHETVGRKECKGKEIQVEIQCPEDTTIMADPALVKRALGNLVDNALRYATSKIEIHCDSMNDQITIHVDDDGPGVAEDEWGKVFQPFYRIDPSRTGDEGGYGLGLAIVSKVMSRLGGEVTVGNSELGGARFTLSFTDSK